jgi:hypothetical protein
MIGKNFLGFMGFHYFHQVGLKKNPKGPTNTIHNNPSRISIKNFIQEYLLGLGPQST